MDLDAFALIRVDPTAYEAAEDLREISARLHTLRGKAEFSLRLIHVSFAGSPIVPAIRVAVTGNGGETWLGVVTGKGLTLNTLGQALRATAPSPASLPTLGAQT